MKGRKRNGENRGTWEEGWNRWRVMTVQEGRKWEGERVPDGKGRQTRTD